LQFDAYTRFGIRSPNTAPLRASRGELDSNGRALSFFTLPAGSNPALVGLTVHHAFLVFDDVVEPGKVLLASNPTPLQLVD
jgi:hypothetical protein